MSHWWRAEDTSIDHPKLLRLSDAMHRAWYTLMCVASANGGSLPPTADIALRLRERPSKVAAWISELVSVGLFDKKEDGTFAPHNWNRRQYKTDASDQSNAQRQREFRARQREELRQLKSLRNASHNALRNNVTNVMAKRPDTETDITTTESVEREPAKGSKFPVSPQLAEILAKGRGG